MATTNAPHNDVFLDTSTAPDIQLPKLQTDLLDRTIFEWVPINKMFVAPYGRPLIPSKVAKYRREWDPNKIGMLYLSLRNNGTYAVLDGHHRASAARAEGMTHLPARVYIDLTYEQEADLYRGFAANTVQTPADLFRARLEQREPIALELQRIVAGQGLKLGLNVNGQVWKRNRPGAIFAVRALEEVHREGGAEMTREVLRILDTAFRDQTHAFAGQSMLGMAAFLKRYAGVMHEPRLMRVLQRHGVEGIISQANVIRKAGLNTLPASFGKAVLIAYNHGLRQGLLPDWIERVESSGAETHEQFSTRAKRAHVTRREQATGTGTQPLPTPPSGGQWGI